MKGLESEPGPGEDEDWEHDWTEEDLSPEQEEDCQVALVQVFLIEPLLEGKLLLLNPELDIVEAMESENQQVWYGVIRAFPEQVLWLVHELDDGTWSEVYSIAVPKNISEPTGHIWRWLSDSICLFSV